MIEKMIEHVFRDGTPFGFSCLCILISKIKPVLEFQ